MILNCPVFRFIGFTIGFICFSIGIIGTLVLIVTQFLQCIADHAQHELRKLCGISSVVCLLQYTVVFFLILMHQSFHR